MKAALEKEIFDLITEFALKYGYLLKSIQCKKYDDDTLDELRFSFALGDFNALAEYNRDIAKILNSGRISETLEFDVLWLIQKFEQDHNITFKSIKSKKDKDGILTSITVDFDGDDIPVIESPHRIKKYHLKEPEQKIPAGFQLYDERIEVAGIQHRRDAAAQFVNQTNQWLEFESEPLNSYDSNAIKILGCYQQDEIIKLHVGYVPARIAKQITFFSADECKARLLKTYIGESGFVEILFQILGPKGRFEEYALLSEPYEEEEDIEDEED